MMTEDISEFIRDKDIEYTFYSKDGEVLSEEVAHACAYILSGDGSKFYYVKVYRSELFDPEGIDANKIIFIDDQIRNVLGARKVGLHALHFDVTDPGTVYQTALNLIGVQ